VDTTAFRADLELIGTGLRELAELLPGIDPLPERPTLVLGMGSSRYAAGPVVRAARAAGRLVAADLASLAGPLPPRTQVVAVSATGTSTEVLTAVRAVAAQDLVAVTNTPTSPLAAAAGRVVDLSAGVERSGVACRTFRHTVLVLLALLHADGAPDPAGLARRAAQVADGLLGSADRWLPPVAEALDGPDGVWVLGSGPRWAAAQQTALMLREVPRRTAAACETGDWSHVDVYLSLPLDYRALVLAGSRWDGAALEWLTARGCTWVAVGGPLRGARASVRHAGEDDPWVATLVEPLVGELLAEHWLG
jgi:fructoselysine-6-P-deglycase FrlB-like protein